MRFQFGYCALLAAALVVSGCGSSVNTGGGSTGSGSSGSGGSGGSSNAAPTVATVGPTGSSTGVAVASTVTVTFSEAMTASSVSASTFTVSDSAGNVTGTVTCNSPCTIATFTPSASLVYNTQYTATITTGVTAANGTALAKNYSWTFTTAAPASAPTVTATTPVSSATGVDMNTTVTATFSEAMNSATLTASTFTLSPQGAYGDISGTVTCNSPCTTATFTPSAPLVGGTEYTATITTGAADPSGTALAANYTWNFTTIAGTGPTPTLVSATPANGTTGVGTNTTVTATFSENMAASTITSSTFTLTLQSGSPIAGTVTCNSPCTTATFTPSAPLSTSTMYFAGLAPGITSAGGVALGGQSWDFTTGSGVSTAPTVTSVNPAPSAFGVAITSAVTVTFNEAMTASTLNGSTFTLTSNSGAVTGTVSCGSPCTTATFTPSANLAYSTNYTATVTTGATASSGAAMAANYTWSFFTAAAPVLTVSNPTPANGATDVSLTQVVSATFNQPMNSSTVNSTTFTLSGPSGAVTGTVAYDSGTNTATFTPSANLGVGDTYTATITTGAKDTSGLALTSNYTWTFTTQGYPTTVDFGTTYQTIRGFGGSTAWLGTLTTQQATALFSQSSGLGLSILRMRIDPEGSASGGGQFNMPYETGEWDQELANGQEAVAANPNAIVFASPWTPPAAWKLNGTGNQAFDSSCGEGSGYCGGYLDPNHYADYASYLEDFVNFFDTNSGGINLYAISMQNEPDWNPTSDPYESCIWTPAQMDAFVASLTAGGATDPITARLIMPESLNFNPNQAKPTLTDPNAVNNVSIVAGHLYGVSPAPYPFPAGVSKPLWMTEHATCESNCPAASVNDAIGSAEEVFNSMTVGNYSAYVWWWIWNDPSDGVTYGLINSDTSNPAPTFYGYGIGQYSKFVQPGYVRASATASPASNVFVSAYSGSGHYVIVAINANNTATNLSFTLDNASAVTSLTPWQTTSSGGLQQQTPVTVTNGQLDYTLPAESITTLVQ